MSTGHTESRAGEHFTHAEREVLYRVLAARRDMRHFKPGQSVEPAVLQRIR